MLLHDLADACRKSGLKVVEVPGWRTRGHGNLYGLQTIAVHHTATAKTAPGDYPSLGVVRDGRPGLPGPLSQLGLGRSGTVYVIAAGVAYHAGATFEQRQDNWHALGIEAEHNGLDPWPPALVDAYARLCAALCEHYDLPPERVLGHKEIATPRGRKTDPNFDMGAFRARVTEHLEDDMALTKEQVEQLDRIEKNGDRLLRIADRHGAQRKAQAKRAMDRLNRILALVTDGDRDHTALTDDLEALREDVAALADDAEEA